MTAVDLPAVPRVLIAEADPWSRDLLKQVLLNVRCDARLDLCADGQEALELLSAKPYDLIIADWELPGIDGLALLRSVRQRKRNPHVFRQAQRREVDDRAANRTRGIDADWLRVVRRS